MKHVSAVRTRGILCIISIFLAATLISLTMTNQVYARQTGHDQAVRHSSQYFFDLRNSGHDIGKTLDDAGIRLRLFTEAAGTASVGGGLSTGSVWYDENYFGATFDLDKIIGLHGSKFVFLTASQLGALGATDGPPSITGTSMYNHVTGGDGLWLYEAAWSQSFFEGKTKLLFGYLGAPTGFTGGYNVLPWVCSFASLGCGTADLFALDAAIPVYMEGAPGILIKQRLAEGLSIQASVYKIQEKVLRSNKRGWTGSNWSLNGAKGATIPVQLNYRHQFGPDKLQGMFNIGFDVRTDEISNPLRNSSGGLLARDGGTPATHRNAVVGWVNVQQEVYAKPNGQGSFWLFGRAQFGQSYLPVQNEFDLGALWYGIVPGRPKDALNIRFSALRLNHEFVEAENQSIDRMRYPQGMPNATQMVEVNYSLVFAPGATLRPYFEYVRHPEEFGGIRTKRPIDHTTILGVQLVLNFNGMFDLPTPDVL